MNACLTFHELLEADRAETARWHAWFQAHPKALDLPTDTANATDVRGLVLHIFAVELRYAERVSGEEPTPYDRLPSGDVDDLFGVHSRAVEKFRAYLDQATDEDLAQTLTFETRSAGTLSASRRKIVAHAFLHGIRHWAQIATLLRSHGFKQDWPHDILFSEAIR